MLGLLCAFHHLSDGLPGDTDARRVCPPNPFPPHPLPLIVVQFGRGARRPRLRSASTALAVGIRTASWGGGPVGYAARYLRSRATLLRRILSSCPLLLPLASVHADVYGFLRAGGAEGAFFAVLHHITSTAARRCYFLPLVHCRLLALQKKKTFVQLEFCTS